MTDLKFVDGGIEVKLAAGQVLANATLDYLAGHGVQREHFLCPEHLKLVEDTHGIDRHRLIQVLIVAILQDERMNKECHGEKDAPEIKLLPTAVIAHAPMCEFLGGDEFSHAFAHATVGECLHDPDRKTDA